MTLRVMKEWVTAEPFRPFIMKTRDGRNEDSFEIKAVGEVVFTEPDKLIVKKEGFVEEIELSKIYSLRIIDEGYNPNQR